MTNLADKTFDEIYNKVMLVLAANEEKLFDQSTLYNKVIDKFDTSVIMVDPQFKYKFFIVIRDLMSKSDDVKVIKENGVYYTIFNPPKNITIEKPVNYDSNWLNEDDFTKYIISNNVTNMNFQDPENGNTVFHHVLGGNDYLLAKELLAKYRNDYLLENSKGNTPIDCIKDIKIATLVITDLQRQVSYIESKLTYLEQRNMNDFFDNISIYKFLHFKLDLLIKRYIDNIFYFLISLLLILVAILLYQL